MDAQNVLIRLLQDDVSKDKFDWLNEIQINVSKIISTQKIQNIFICKNNEYELLPYQETI